ncbi:hypothetical protein D3C80_1277820 [compost metagenome]
MDQQQGVIVVAVEQRLQRCQIALGGCIITQIDRISWPDKLRQGSAQLLLSLICQRCQLTVAGDQLVQRHGCGGRAIADYH